MRDPAAGSDPEAGANRRCHSSQCAVRAKMPSRVRSGIRSRSAASRVPITAQDGMVFHARVPEGSLRVLAASGRWVTAMTAARLAGSPLAKQPGTRLGLM